MYWLEITFGSPRGLVDRLGAQYPSFHLAFVFAGFCCAISLGHSLSMRVRRQMVFHASGRSLLFSSVFLLLCVCVSLIVVHLASRWLLSRWQVVDLEEN